jgi:hypothetical protein
MRVSREGAADCSSLRKPRSHLPYGIHKRLVCFLRLWTQASKWLDRLVRRVTVGHPGGPCIVHVLRSNVLADRQGEDRIHKEQQISVPFGQDFLRHLASDPLRYVSDVVQSTVPTKTAA